MSATGKAGAKNKLGRKRRPVLDAVHESITKRRFVDVALPISNDSRALPNVASRLEGREKLEVNGLRKLASKGLVLARGRVYDAATHRPLTWRLRILLSKSVRRGAGAQ